MRTLRYALRALARTPALTAVVVLSLALGIGANAALFSLVRQVLVRPLPVREPERLVNVASPGPKDGRMWTNLAGDDDAVFSYAMFRDLERAAPRAGLAGLAAHQSIEVNLAVGARTQAGRAVLVSGSYFPVLGLTPALGRLLGPADDGAPGAHPVAVLSHAYWTARLGADPGVVGRAVTVNGRALTVVGVAPSGFTGTTRGNAAEVFVPITMRGALVPGDRGLEDRRDYWTYLFGRLRPGVTPDAAQRGLDAVHRRILTEVEVPAQTERSPRFLAEFGARRLELAPGARGQSRIFGRTRGPLALLFAAAGVVLLIACANVANLLLARGAGRAGEMALRLSLGAGRRRLVRQLLAEAGVLAAVGGVAGLVVARGTLAGIAALLPTALETLTPALDWPAAAFAAVVSAAVALAVGLSPRSRARAPT
jgi:predicted permease